MRQGAEEQTGEECRECLDAIQKFAEEMAEVRAAMRQMGEMAGVPLEPPPQVMSPYALARSSSLCRH